MPAWLSDVFEKSNFFMPHGHCYLWIPSLLWMHVISDALIGIAYLGISFVLYLLVKRIRLPFSPVFIAFGLFIGLCGLTHFMSVWTVWNPDYFLDGLIKVATAAASVATAVGLLYVRPQVEEVVHAARLSEERRIRLESTNAELEVLYRKVKELDEVKTQFFANVSHELRTPLALVLGPAERLLEDDNLTDDQRRQLESISRNGKALLMQVNDLLDASRLEAGKMQLRYAHMDLASLFRRVVSRFEVAAEERRISLQASMPEHLDVDIDPDMLERVLVNLLSNAFKFTPAGGSIRVVLQREKDQAMFRVADTGPGIDPSQHEAVFERFRQVEGSSTRKHGGTGLGLAIVKDFVDLHRGRIDLHSTPGAGAEFVVHLPLAAPAGSEVQKMPSAPGELAQVALEGVLQGLKERAAPASGDAIPADQTARPYVLVVEDNPDMSEFVATTLSDRFNVITARDGREGLERALALKPDLIVTDLMMPHMSGDQLVAALRGRSEFDAVPVLLLTAKADDELRIALLKNGAQDYLTKPFLPQELLARAGNLVAMKQAGDALRTELSSVSGDVSRLATELAARHRQLQTALEATDVAREQAEQASRVKTHFLGMISHEMRTPLTSIFMNAQLLDRYRGGPAQDAFQARVGRLIRASHQLATMIEGLLEFTRLESGKVVASTETVDTVALAQEVVAAHAEDTSTQVHLALEPPPPGLASIASDPRLLRVILGNLLSNALKFTQKGTVTLRLARSGAWHIFEVEDTGVGIPEEDIPRIFLPFEQLEPVQRKSIPGVGLGLALVQQIVENLGGRVEVASKAGAGSTFRVLLPVQAATAPAVTGIEQKANS